jgi:hypothetical protein
VSKETEKQKKKKEQKKKDAAKKSPKIKEKKGEYGSKAQQRNEC